MINVQTPTISPEVKYDWYKSSQCEDCQHKVENNRRCIYLDWYGERCTYKEV